MNRSVVRASLGWLIGFAWLAVAEAQEETAPIPDATTPASTGWRSGEFQWKVSAPILSVDAKRLPPSEEHPWLAIKDPSVVRYDGQWHLFCTLRKDKQGDGRIRIGYAAFDSFDHAQEADWSVLTLTMGYHGAPQIFYFEPQQTWYLIYQAADDSRDLKYGPCYSTTKDIRDPTSWTLPEPLYVVPEGDKAGLDFWVICDKQSAFLFFTSLDGRMWRAQTKLADFPTRGWSRPVVALKADIFEASHTYKLNGLDRYVTLVEAQAGKRRYFKAFTAERLDGTWEPFAGTRKQPLVSTVNVVNQSESWATSYSHGEFLRAGFDQRLEIDPANCRLLFQGASDAEYTKGGYGDITWRLGLLDMVQ